MGAGRDRDGDRATTGQTRYAVPETAEVLGIIAEAVRSRIKRETLPTYREAGAVFVVLEADKRRSVDRPAGQDPRDELLEEQRDRITYLNR